MNTSVSGLIRVLVERDGAPAFDLSFSQKDSDLFPVGGVQMSPPTEMEEVRKALGRASAWISTGQ